MRENLQICITLQGTLSLPGSGSLSYSPSHEGSTWPSRTQTVLKALSTGVCTMEEMSSWIIHN